MISDDHFDEFVASAEEAFARDGGDGALAGTGFLDLLHEQLDDAVVRSALFATFRAQGRRLGRSSALFRVMAQPYAELIGRRADAALIALPAQVEDGRAQVAMPTSWPDQLLIDLPDTGVLLVSATDIEVGSHPTMDSDLMVVGSVDIAAGSTVLGPGECDSARVSAMKLGSLAMAFEMLGASESLLSLATEHARHREQFGQPIGAFQAVRHLLAWASLDIQAGDHLSRAAMRAITRDDDMTCEVAKAVVGRNGRRVADRAAQVLGGMGFTWEHPFHTYHRRILVLDSLLGGSGRVMAELGRAALSTGDPASVLPLESQVAQSSLVSEPNA